MDPTHVLLANLTRAIRTRAHALTLVEASPALYMVTFWTWVYSVIHFFSYCYGSGAWDVLCGDEYVRVRRWAERAVFDAASARDWEADSHAADVQLLHATEHGCAALAFMHRLVHGRAGVMLDQFRQAVANTLGMPPPAVMGVADFGEWFEQALADEVIARLDSAAERIMAEAEASSLVEPLAVVDPRSLPVYMTARDYQMVFGDISILCKPSIAMADAVLVLGHASIDSGRNAEDVRALLARFTDGRVDLSSLGAHDDGASVIAGESLENASASADQLAVPDATSDAVA